jgi:DNA-binding transcriptional ArsR family regulator
MSSVFDRLQKQLDIQMRDEGISALEIAELPPHLRRIMRLMLREVEMSYASICAVVDEIPEADRMSRAELDSALATLTRQFWLIRRGEGERVTYQVNLRRKAGSKIAQGLWNILDTRIGQSQSPEKPETKAP